MSRFFRNGVPIVGNEPANLVRGADAPEEPKSTQERTAQEREILHFSLTASQVLDVPNSGHPIVPEVWQSAFNSPAHPVVLLDHFADAALHKDPRLWPALVLASHILKSPKSYQFIHSMIYGRRTIEPPRTDAAKEALVRFWRSQYDTASETYYLPNAEAEKVDEILEEVANDIRYVFWHLSVTREGLCSRDGKTIFINSRRFYGPLDLTGSPELVPRKWLNIAIALVHELMHAVSWRYCIGDVVLIEEMVFENDEIYSKDEAGEVGWAFERFVLGSIRIDERMTDTHVLEFYNQYLP